MPVSADTIAVLLASGVSADKLVDVVRAIDADQVLTQPARTSRQEINHRYYEKKKAENKTSEIRSIKTSESDILQPSDPALSSPNDSINLTPINPSPASLRSALAAPKKRKSAKSGIDEGYQPTDSDSLHAASVGMDRPTFRFEWARYRDHHLKVGSTFSNWSAAWRTWCANWLERKQASARAGPRQNQRGPTMAEMAHMDEPGFLDDQRSHEHQSPAETTGDPDQGRSGFAGRLPLETSAYSGRRVVNF